ncbi:MAG: hypothetical protein COW01_12805 [Bdellovibrionales bacterium CG12_big_fil_rev_8_21_14_0_65_38_15]|nr:MAG: hypothetical protein COW79_08815 [Bdellovibrionales bacterium CG22_combo_CG10-13_8_21_14_all_38_13]PIQ53502.1 MAG: hypothetical protein COW01_12805 [Bdellovibrionales bacterium CG12_big_fil_rev_8_21_14_0_65_38_15]PIR28494.1 MAG: hypothetical protein COV38_15835 [Bdellovibrionales bacterium CG11_big_fil_rev_8_21_14_0_20_38_13]
MSASMKQRWMVANSPTSQWSAMIDSMGIKKSEVSSIKSIIETRNTHYQKVIVLRGIIEKILNFKPSENKSKDGLLLQEFSRNLELLPQGLLKKFGFLLLAKESSNFSQIKGLIEEVIHWEPRVLPFYGIDIPLSDDTWNSVDDLLLGIVKNLKDKILAKAFITRVSQFIDESKLPKLFDEMNTDWSLNDLREIVKSPWYAPLFPAFWFSQLSGRVSTSEMTDINLKLIERKKITQWNDHDLWMFSDWMPNDETLRQDIINSIKRINDLEEDYMKELVVRLAENAIIRRHLDEKKIIPTKVLFKLKRDYYFRLLSAGKHVDYSLYHLLVLGDEDRNYLWWYALDPFKQPI